MKSVIIKQALTGLLFFGMGVCAHAVNPPIHPSDTIISERIDLDDVVVTGSRTTRLLKDVPVPTKVFKAKDIKAIAPSSFADILQYILPGVEFTKHGSRDQFNAQGFDESSMLFLVDGELITTGSTSGIDFERINPDDIERIEVLRGASSALYGSNAIGGVINIITRSAKSPLHVSASARLDSRAGQKYDVSAGVKRGMIASQTSAQYRTDAGYTLADQFEQELNVAGNTTWNVNQKFVFTPTDKLSFHLGGLVNLRTQHWTDKIDFLYNSYDIKAGSKWQISPSSDVEISYHYDKYQRDTCLIQTPDKKKRSIFDEDMHHLRAQYNLNLSDVHIVNIGAEYIHDLVASPRLSSPTDPGEKSVDNKILYGQYIYKVTPRFMLSYGGRLDKHSGYGSHYTSRLSAMYKTGCVAHRLSYGEGYRAPSLQELFFFFNHGAFFIYGNPELQPEKSRMLSYSAEGRWNKLTLVGTAFYNHVRNRIDFVYRGTDLVYANVAGVTRIFGFEAQANVTLPYGFALRASYSYTYDHRKATDKEGNTMKLSNTRPHAATAALTYGHRFTKDYKLSANLSTRFLSVLKTARLDSEELFQVVKYPGYAISRLDVENQFFGHYTLHIGAENLFDYKPKALVFNSPISPGRILYGMLRVTF
ncbi:TonB-dependent outer-membrane receptor HmuR [Porphyromonas loveana]|uniref:TonB-dependent outer-membrane receptor HmuR n=1 Tax=Porphyromonas loveana TaxID=1884669 RepID=UPI0035A0513C